MRARIIKIYRRYRLSIPIFVLYLFLVYFSFTKFEIIIQMVEGLFKKILKYIVIIEVRLLLMRGDL